MRKFIGLMLLLGLFSLAAVAQENYSKAEVFGGYQYTRFDGGVNANGFNGAITGNLDFVRSVFKVGHRNHAVVW